MEVDERGARILCAASRATLLAMRSAAFAVLASLLCLSSANAADTRDLAKMLEEAERIRGTDKVKSRQLLDQVERALTPASDPLIAAQAQLLECKFADTPAAAYPAVVAGLRLAERANNVALRVKLMACRGNALEFDGRSVEAEKEFGAAAVLASGAKEQALEAEARGRQAWLQYSRGAMADALANLQTDYRISAQLGNEKERLDALSVMANVYADANVGQYDRAIEYYRQLVTEYGKHGQPNDVADTLFNIGSTFETKGNPSAAELYYRRALASAIMKQDRAAEALPYFEAALAFYEKERDAGNIAFVKQFRGMAYRRLGRADDALRDLAAARSYYEKDQNARFLDKNSDETALVYEQLGDWR